VSEKKEEKDLSGPWGHRVSENGELGLKGTKEGGKGRLVTNF